jgi:hypothetical protein
VNEARATGVAMGRARNGNLDDARAATAVLNGKPNQIGSVPARHLGLRRPIGTPIPQEPRIGRRPTAEDPIVRGSASNVSS